MRSPWRIWWATAVLVGIACQPEANRPIEESSASVIVVNPASASPGAGVTVTTDKAVFSADAGTKVLIGNESVTIQTARSGTEAYVIVPNQPAGVAQVQVVETGKRAGAAGQLNILAAPVQRLLLNFAGNQVQLIDAKPRPGGFGEGGREDGRRLSYDVFDSQGRVVFTNTIVHPTLGRREVYEEQQPGKFFMRGVAESPSSTFVVKIPNLGGPMKVRFYDAAPELDLSTAKGRDARVFLNEIAVGG